VGIFDCSFDVYLCCGADTHTTPAFPVLLCYWYEAENWDHWSDIPQGKSGSISWLECQCIAKQVASVLIYSGKSRRIGDEQPSGKYKIGGFCEFLGAPLSYFAEFSSDQLLNAGVLVGHLLQANTGSVQVLRKGIQENSMFVL